MWLLYLIALILGGGILFVQLVSGGHHDVGAGPDAGLDHTHPTLGPGIISTRSLTFGIAAFGLVGAPLHILGILSPRLALIVAGATALAATSAAGLAFRALGHPSASGAVSLDELVGRDAKVLVTCGRNQRGKVRVSLGGQLVDLIATTDAESLGVGSEVRVVGVRDDVAHVAPR